MTAAFGTAIFMVLSNALGYVLPIHTAFWVTLLILVVLCCILIRLHQPGKMEPTPRWVWWVLGTLGALAGFATARFLTSDPWVWSYLPLSATVQSGNFPIHEPTNPWSMLGYHYGPQFLAAGFSSLTGLSLAVSYNVQPFIGALGGLFFAAALVLLIRKSWTAAVLGAVLAFLGTGFTWIHLGTLVTDLVRHFILGQAMSSPFRALSDSFANTFGPSLAIVFGSRTYTLGFPFLYGLLYAYAAALLEEDSTLRRRWILVALALALALALTAETALVLLAPTAGAYLLFLWIEREKRHAMSWQRVFTVSFLILVPAFLLSVIQGGVLTAMLHATQQINTTSFTWNDGRLPQAYPHGERVAFWEWKFILATGLPFLLFPVACVSVWRKRRQMPLAVFLAMFALFHFVVAFAVRYIPIQNNMIRLVHLALSLSSLLIGVMLADTLLLAATWKRVAAWIVIAAMTLSSVLYVMTRAIIPTMRLEVSPLFAEMPPASDGQLAMYAWVREHTTLHDYFYQRSQLYDPFAMNAPPPTESEEEGQQRERILFMAYTGRFSIGFLHWGSWDPAKLDLVHKVEERCDVKAFHDLILRYLVIENESRMQWFRAHCKGAAWKIAYDGGTQKKPWPRMYEVAK